MLRMFFRHGGHHIYYHYSHAGLEGRIHKGKRKIFIFPFNKLMNSVTFHPILKFKGKRKIFIFPFIKLMNSVTFHPNDVSRDKP